MGNLIITMIGIAFTVALATAGINYINPTAYIEEVQSSQMRSQIQNLLTDYENLVINLNRRPIAQDYYNVFLQKSPNLVYNYNTTNPNLPIVSTASTSDIQGNWIYVPGCGGGLDDCFYIGLSNQPPVAYKAAQMLAFQLLATSTASQLEFSTNSGDDPNAILNPNNWPATQPTTPYFLTVRLKTGT